MEQSIGDILNGETAPEPEAVTEQPVEQAEVQTEAEPAKAEQPRGPDGKFAPKEPTGVQEQETAEPVPPTEPTDRLPPAEYAALKDERRKRQELEQRLQLMEQQLRQPAQPQQPQQPAPDFWEDPHQFLQGKFSEFGEQLFQQFEQRQQATRIDQSEAAARARHADYDQALAAFSSAVQANPRLAAEMAQAPDPAEYAYSKGKTALTLESVGSLEDYEAQLRQKWEAEARAAIQPLRPTLPSTTASDGSVGGRSGPEWSGPKPLGSLLG